MTKEPETWPQRSAGQVLRVLDAGIGGLAVGALLALVAIVFVNVVGRYGFSQSFVGSLDAARWLFIAIILLGVPLAHRMRTHLVITIFVDALPRPARRLANFLADFIVAYSTVMLMAGGATLISVIGGTSVTLKLPQWFPYIAIPISCVLGLVYLLLRGIDEGQNQLHGPIAIGCAIIVYLFFQDTLVGALTGINPVAAMGVSFGLALLIGAPVSFAMLLSAFVANFAGEILPPAAVVQNLVKGSSKFLMLAIPFFILAGTLMNAGGLTRRLMDFAFSLVGHMRGGLAQVNIVSSGLYAGVSGSSYSDAALGTKTAGAADDPARLLRPVFLCGDGGFRDVAQHYSPVDRTAHPGRGLKSVGRQTVGGRRCARAAHGRLSDDADLHRFSAARLRRRYAKSVDE